MTGHVFNSPLPDIDIPDIPITEFVLNRVSVTPQQAAMIDGVSGQVHTFKQLSDAIHSIAGGLQSEGFAEGSVLALIAPNCPEYTIVFHAVAVCGGTVTTVNPAYGAEEIQTQLKASGASIAVTVPDSLATVQKAANDTPVTEIITIGKVDGLRSIDDLKQSAIKQVPVNLKTNTIVLPYSSGTTGMPKGVMLSHYNLVSNLEQLNRTLHYEPGEVALAVLPFFHIYGMQAVMGSLLAAGVTVVTLPRFDLEQVLSLIEKYSVTQFFVVPPIVLAFAKHPLVDKYDLSSLRKIFSGAAPLGGELTAEAAARVDCKVVQGYGMTELSPVSHCTPDNNLKVGSCGITVPNTQCRIVAENGDSLGVDEVGELWVKGPQVMLGYLNDPDSTAEILDADGWLRTGDVARIDADGHMFIVDRVKELIKYKGFQVAPAELEALIVTHPAVADVAVIGMADDEAGEVPKAFVALKPDVSATAEEIQAFVKQHVASYKQIRVVEFVDSIPKSPSGKILRRLLRDGAG